MILANIQSTTSLVIKPSSGTGLPNIGIISEYRQGYENLFKNIHNPSIPLQTVPCLHLNTGECQIVLEDRVFLLENLQYTHIRLFLQRNFWILVIWKRQIFQREGIIQENKLFIINKTIVI